MKRLITILALSTAVTLLSAQTPLSLDLCLKLARENNPELRKSQLNVKRAEEVKAQAFTKYFPQVQGTGFAYHALHPLVDVSIDDIANESVRELLILIYENLGAEYGMPYSLQLFQHGYLFGVTAIQPIFVGGKIVNGNRLAKVGVEAAKLQAQIDERDILEQTEEAYWLVYGLQQKQHIIDDAVSLLDTLYETVNTAVQAGLALPSDISQVSIRRNEIARKQLQLQSGLRLSRRALSLATGLPEDSINALEEPDINDVGSNTLEEPYTPTPEHELLALQVRAAELERKIALADALPQLALGANYSYSHFTAEMLKNGLSSKTGNGALFVTLQVPLSGWWETAHKLKEKRYAIEQAQIDAAFLGDKLSLRDQQAYDQLMESEALLQLQQQMATQAEDTYNQTLANYEAGRATIVELLQAQMTRTQSAVDLTDAQIEYLIHLQRYKDLH